MSHVRSHPLRGRGILYVGDRHLTNEWSEDVTCLLKKDVDLRLGQTNEVSIVVLLNVGDIVRVGGERVGVVVVDLIKDVVGNIVGVEVDSVVVGGVIQSPSGHVVCSLLDCGTIISDQLVRDNS